jgi:hypothetical protein
MLRPPGCDESSSAGEPKSLLLQARLPPGAPSRTLQRPTLGHRWPVGPWPHPSSLQTRTGSDGEASHAFKGRGPGPRGVGLEPTTYGIAVFKRLGRVVLKCSVTCGFVPSRISRTVNLRSKGSVDAYVRAARAFGLVTDAEIVQLLPTRFLTGSD